MVKIAISRRALIQRLRRALQADGKHLRTARADKRKLFGHYYLVGRKELIENVDIEKLARDLKVLEPWEALSD
jgi:ABC-type phosphate/phosphonate transport system ATPase subunit